MRPRILIAEDDPLTAELLQTYLEREGYQVLLAHDGRVALELARRQEPDLLLLDLMLPGVDGADICRLLRAESRVPIIMVTARSTEGERLQGFDLGADDYITKPFSPREVVARVRAVLRRAGEERERAPRVLRFGPLEINLSAHEVRVGGQGVRLTPKEFRLLETMARAPGRAFSRNELVEQVFGFDYEGFDRTVDVHMMNLRKKLEADPARPRYLHTVYGVGYKFTEDGHDL